MNDVYGAQLSTQIILASLIAKVAALPGASPDIINEIYDTVIKNIDTTDLTSDPEGATKPYAVRNTNQVFAMAHLIVDPINFSKMSPKT